MRKRQREKVINITTNITTTILEVLFRLGGATSDILSNRKDFYNQINSHGFDRIAISNRVRDLINSGHIEAAEESGSKSVRLTRKGKIKRLEQNTDHDSDGKWRFISFDIPEDRKPLRVALTRSLRRIGYKPIQKSLWACPFNKVDDIDLLITEMGINEFVANFRIETTDIEEHLKELFDSELA